MSNNIRAIRSNPTFVPLTGDPERILCDQDLSFRAVYHHESFGRTGSIDQEPIHTLEQELSLLDCKGPSALPASRIQSASAAVIPVPELSPQVCEHIWQVVAEEIAQENAKLSEHATQKAVNSALSDIFFSPTYAKADGGLKKTFVDLLKRFSPTWIKKEL